MTDYLSQPLIPEHLCDRFRSGQEPLDRWLREQAVRAQRARTARTNVWVRPDDLHVLAYYSSAPTQVLRTEGLSRSMAGGHSVVPAFLLARLALDRELQGDGLGTELLLDALDVIVEASNRGGGRVIVVDAIDQNAREFYVHHDFQPIGNSDRLVMKVATAEKALQGRDS